MGKPIPVTTHKHVKGMHLQATGLFVQTFITHNWCSNPPLQIDHNRTAKRKRHTAHIAWAPSFIPETFSFITETALLEPTMFASIDPVEGTRHESNCQIVTSGTQTASGVISKMK
jgi:hypothetical protein